MAYLIKIIENIKTHTQDCFFFGLKSKVNIINAQAKVTEKVLLREEKEVENKRKN